MLRVRKYPRHTIAIARETAKPHKDFSDITNEYIFKLIHYWVTGPKFNAHTKEERRKIKRKSESFPRKLEITGMLD